MGLFGVIIVVLAFAAFALAALALVCHPMRLPGGVTSRQAVLPAVGVGVLLFVVGGRMIGTTVPVTGMDAAAVTPQRTTGTSGTTGTTTSPTPTGTRTTGSRPGTSGPTGPTVPPTTSAGPAPTPPLPPVPTPPLPTSPAPTPPPEPRPTVQVVVTRGAPCDKIGDEGVTVHGERVTCERSKGPVKKRWA